METVMAELLAINEPEIMSSELAAELESIKATSAIETTNEVLDETALSTGSLEENVQSGVAPVIPDDILTNKIYLDGVNYLVDTIDPYSVNEEIMYKDYPAFYASGEVELPDYAVVYQVNGYDVIFPTDYADNIIVADGLLINLGSNYTAGVQMDGYSVNNYLNSEIAIPTYHSATWYQYLQTYGQPYRIVDRYVNSYGNITSSTRDSVYVEWTGGNPWAGFTFDRIAMFITIIILIVMFIFRKGNK